MRFSWFTPVLAAMALALPVAAQEAVGSTIIGGRPVQLLSDFTWKYVSNAPSGCEAIENGVSFCGMSAGWVKYPPASREVDANYRLGDDTFGLFLTEGVGSDAGVTIEFLRNAVVRNALRPTGDPASDIGVVGPTPVVVDGYPGETISYRVKADDVPFVFIVTMVLDKRRSAQLVTYTLGTALTDEMTAVHARFLEQTRLK